MSHLPAGLTAAAVVWTLLLLLMLIGAYRVYKSNVDTTAELEEEIDQAFSGDQSKVLKKMAASLGKARFRGFWGLLL